MWHVIKRAIWHSSTDDDKEDKNVKLSIKDQFSRRRRRCREGQGLLIQLIAIYRSMIYGCTSVTRHCCSLFCLPSHSLIIYWCSTINWCCLKRINWRIIIVFMEMSVWVIKYWVSILKPQGWRVFHQFLLSKKLSKLTELSKISMLSLLFTISIT